MATARKTTERGVDETAETLSRLKSQMAEKESILAGIDGRRRKFAFRASQGDEAAAAELDQIVADESDAANATKNLRLAIEEAQRERDDAVARSCEADVERSYRILARLSDDLIASDLQVVDAITALHAILEQRSSTIKKIVGCGLLPASTTSRFSDRTVDSAIMGGLQKHAPRNADTARLGALSDLVEVDCRLLERECPLPPRKLTATEVAFRQSALSHPSEFGKKGINSPSQIFPKAGLPLDRFAKA